ncbi:MAG TPA: hypothetical protein VNH64_12090, partial [Parvularculaceae bacterium]|nr:hypothetical protein [Parvularculaceae bacterium]
MKTKRYLVFGPGRVGLNFAAYARGLGHDARLVSREEATGGPARLSAFIAGADIIAAAIPDSALAGFAKEWNDA